MISETGARQSYGWLQLHVTSTCCFQARNSRSSPPSHALEVHQPGTQVSRVAMKKQVGKHTREQHTIFVGTLMQDSLSCKTSYRHTQALEVSDSF